MLRSVFPSCVGVTAVACCQLTRIPTCGIHPLMFHQQKHLLATESLTRPEIDHPLELDDSYALLVRFGAGMASG